MLNSCFTQDSQGTDPFGSNPEPTDQPVSTKLIFNYNGTARSQPMSQQTFYFTISGPTSLDMSKNWSTGQLNNGETISVTLKRGSYDIVGYWDWDGSGDQQANEQTVSETFSITEDAQTIDVSVKDNTSPNDDGSISGTVVSGLVGGNHLLYAVLRDFNTGQIVTQGTLGTQKVDAYNNPQGYIIQNLVSGDYSLLFFWDTNDNGTWDNNDPANVEVPIYVSPGLITHIDFRLN